MRNVNNGTESNRYADIDELINNHLKGLEGYVNLHRIDDQDIHELGTNERLNEKKKGFRWISADNLGVRESLKREFKYAIAYLKPLFKNYNSKIEESSVLFICDDNIIGEDISSNKRLKKNMNDRNSIFIGSNFVFYKDKMRNSKGETRIIIPCKKFPPLEGFPYASDVISGSPSSSTDKYFKTKMGLNACNPELGTIIIGFNSTDYQFC
jgi:hypothetical protein